MKWLSLFLLLILISGCVPTLEESEVLVKRGVYKVKEELEKELGIEEYVMKVGGEVAVDDKPVRLVSFGADYAVVFNVDGAEIEIKETQDPQILNDIELTIREFRYNAADMENNYIKVKIVKFVPEENQYLFHSEDTKQILDHKIELVKIEKDGTAVIMVDRVNELRVMEDETGSVANLYVSNVRGVYRPIASERHVILKVVEKP